MKHKHVNLRYLVPTSVAALLALAACTTQLPAATPGAATGSTPSNAVVEPTSAATAAVQPVTPLATATVAAEGETGAANDAMTITSTLPVPESAIERQPISFDTGPTQEISGLLPSGPGVNQYLIDATEGQTLTVDITSDGSPLSLTIESPSGNQWIPEMMNTDGGYTIGHELSVPESGEYVVTMVKPDHTPSTNFTATFTLQ